MFENEFLTIEQAKELKELGINFDSAKYCYRKIDNYSNPVYKYLEDNAEEFSTFVDSVTHTTEQDIEIIPTFSISELFNILPKCIDYNGISNNPITIFLDKNTYDIEFWDSILDRYHCASHKLLRDSLFDMIKWLKIKNLIK